MATHRVATRHALTGIALVAVMLAGCSASEEVTYEFDRSDPDVRGTGDPAILSQLERRYPGDHHSVAAAVVAGDEIRTAFLSADGSTMFEIASVTTTLTGLLLASALERGEVRLEDRLGQYLDLGDSDAASVTLEQLATHRAGMPPISPDPEFVREFDRQAAAGQDPDEGDVAQLLAHAASVEIPEDPPYRYSDMGAALLGHALAAAAGADYGAVLRERVLDPAGMESAVVVETAEQVPAALALGHSASNRPIVPWSFEAYTPATGVDAALDDLVALAAAVLSGAFSESPALDPVSEVDAGTSVGYLWFIDEHADRTLTGHDGRSGGFGSTILIDRDAGTASIVLRNSAGDTRGTALGLIQLAGG
ncbi:serine hydrolase domain-containing protein [Agromyces sp. ZXT2-6]|uniref:serine hydrolase domain-containing protein n=1 Tax=Agromyces sp. ZXT2-6 TaxID=3461153 RepID=UPI004054F54E